LPGITESVVRRDLSGRTRHDSPCLPRTEISARSPRWLNIEAALVLRPGHLAPLLNVLYLLAAATDAWQLV
jgi:hypothetical protein